MNRQWALLAALVVVAVGALVFRVPRLNDRPMHGDEAIHAFKFNDELWTRGIYVYDRVEYHGPTLNYFTFIPMWLSGGGYEEATDATFRYVPVVFGAALVLLLWLVRRDLGTWETLVAAVLTALSPAMVYYSRYYIQEMLLVFFTFAAIAGGWRYARSGRVGWAILCGVSLGMAHATKETWVMAAAAMFGAMVLTLLWVRFGEGRSLQLRPLFSWKVLVGFLAGSAVAFAFLSGFFTHLRGPLDSILAYSVYLGRGAGHDTDHVHEWSYYLKMLIFWQPAVEGLSVIDYAKLLIQRRWARGPAFNEAVIIGLFAVGLLTVLVRAIRGVPVTMPVQVTEAVPAAEPSSDDRASMPDTDSSIWHVRFLVFLAVYTLLLTGVYCAIRYKTPWCMLSFLHGMILLAAVGAVGLVRLMPHIGFKCLMALLLAAGAAYLGDQAYQSNFRFYCDRRNPYVYSHPVRDVFDTTERMENLAGVSPQKHHLSVVGLTKDIWPMPYYLRRFKNAGYWISADLAAYEPEEAKNLQRALAEKPEVVFGLVEQQSQIEPLLKAKYHPFLCGLRPTVHLVMYIRQDLWEAYIATRQKR